MQHLLAQWNDSTKLSAALKEIAAKNSAPSFSADDTALVTDLTEMIKRAVRETMEGGDRVTIQNALIDRAETVVQKAGNREPSEGTADIKAITKALSTDFDEKCAIAEKMKAASQTTAVALMRRDKARQRENDKREK